MSQTLSSSERFASFPNPSFSAIGIDGRCLNRIRSAVCPTVTPAGSAGARATGSSAFRNTGVHFLWWARLGNVAAAIRHFFAKPRRALRLVVVAEEG